MPRDSRANELLLVSGFYGARHALMQANHTCWLNLFLQSPCALLERQGGESYQAASVTVRKTSWAVSSI